MKDLLEGLAAFATVVSLAVVGGSWFIKRWRQTYSPFPMIWLLSDDPDDIARERQDRTFQEQEERRQNSLLARMKRFAGMER